MGHPAPESGHPGQQLASDRPAATSTSYRMPRAATTTRRPPARRIVLGVGEAWRRPAHETADHPLLAGEPARLHEEKAAETLEAALAGAPEGLEPHRHTVGGHARRVLVNASHGADLLVVGAWRNPGALGLQLGRVAHTALHHSACPVAVVPQRG